MLAPQSNASRTILDFSGVWDFRLKPDAPWQSIAVPASYNDQSADPEFRRHVGLAWYRRSITVPSLLKGQRLMLRFDAVTHNARVFLDGQLLCTHRGGFLPFEADVTDILHPGQTALLEVEVDNTISHHTLPVGNEGGTAFFGSDNPGIPSVEAGKQHQHEQGINLPNFDFFNYAGLNRPVHLYTTPADYIADVTLVSSMDGTVRYTIVTHGEGDVTLDVLDADGQVVASGTGASGEVHVANPHLWEPAPGVPYLYTARVRFAQDEYSQPFGIREIKVDGCRFLINGKPFHFHGPCKHEDSFFHGRGLDQCLNVTDISLFHWLALSSVSILFLALSGTCTSIMQGTGKIYYPLMFLGISCIVKIALNLILMPLEQINIYAFAISTTICYLLSAALGLRFITRRQNVKIDVMQTFFKPLACTLAMTVTLLLFSVFASDFVNTTLGTVTAILAGGTVYAAMIVLLKVFGSVNKVYGRIKARLTGRTNEN